MKKQSIKSKAENSILKTRKRLILRFRNRKKFVRQNVFRQKKLSSVWRKPRGIHNKMRHKMSGKPCCPNPGYRSPALIRKLHPSGYEEIYVRCMKDLSLIEPKTQAARISASIGKKLRLEIIKKSRELGVRVLNPRVV